MAAPGSEPIALATNGIYEIVEGPQGRLWIGTQGGGVLIYEGVVLDLLDTGQDHAHRHQDDLRPPDTARGKAVSSVLSKRDALVEFDATYGRVARFLETLWGLADGRTKIWKLRPAANPAPAAGKAAAASQGASRACPKGKSRKSRLQEPTEPSFRTKRPSGAVLTGFCAPKSSQHRRLTPVRRPESTRPQRLSAACRPFPPNPRGTDPIEELCLKKLPRRAALPAA